MNISLPVSNKKIQKTFNVIRQKTVEREQVFIFLFKNVGGKPWYQIPVWYAIGLGSIAESETLGTFFYIITGVGSGGGGGARGMCPPPTILIGRQWYVCAPPPPHTHTLLTPHFYFPLELYVYIKLTNNYLTFFIYQLIILWTISINWHRWLLLNNHISKYK